MKQSARQVNETRRSVLKNDQGFPPIHAFAGLTPATNLPIFAGTVTQELPNHENIP